MDNASNLKNIKIYFNKFIKLPITYKILSSILVSLLIHISFSLLFYLGIYFYTKEYSIPYETIDMFNTNLLIVPFYLILIALAFCMGEIKGKYVRMI